MFAEPKEDHITSAQQQFQERVVKCEEPLHRHLFLMASNGAMLRMHDDGELRLSEEADDDAVWDRHPEGFRHVASGRVVPADGDGGTLLLDGKKTTFSVGRGPERMPSEHLQHLKGEGWVCLTSILPPATVEGLERIACSDRYEQLEQDNSQPKICQHAAVGRAIAEPLSLWLIREYLGTRDLHLGHPPGFGVLAPYDGAGKVQGWHCDIPYIPSIGGNPVADRHGPIKAVQRNVCVSDFTKERGATAYKLGSHRSDHGPPPEWKAPAEGGLPYTGPDADVLEAPGGSIVLYDARTWHRAGINRTQRKRAAMLQSFQTADVIPKRDTRPVYARLRESPVYGELNAREQREIAELLLNQPSHLAV